MKVLIRALNFMTLLLLIASIYFFINLNKEVHLAGGFPKYIISTDRNIIIKDENISIFDDFLNKFVINKRNYEGNISQFQDFFTVVNGVDGSEKWNNNGLCDYFKVTFKTNEYILNLSCLSVINEI